MGQQIAQTLSNRHGFSVDAVAQMLTAVYNGNGSMAQFSHPEFGGSGQWMAGGMMMIGDMFNQNLKYRVAALCEDCARSIAENQTGTGSGVFQSQSQSGGSNYQDQQAGGGSASNSLFAPDPRRNWWPQELGSPSASGSQNQMRYAYFADAHRLAVATGDDVWLYDTLQHNIGGFSQQQSGDGSITFTSQFGVVPLSSLPIVSRNGVEQPPMPPAPTPVPPAQTPPPATFPNQTAPSFEQSQPDDRPTNNSAPAPSSNSNEVFDTLDRLGGLLDKGYITQEEFNRKKSDLLDRI
ncbi:SHOCT domain-containing protein [Rhodopirellula sp. P2]|uniref:SHOCT domain-containing protein n=1 Tax=Rhodopirellula sp. P2 TaxID=2127060 RepID=UPI00236870A9|nr:SHOCT domain-containing protein [Rhodopirellula sp. P2]WDQ19491.1 SHOCT domain-containing protein [Rhodopirellula sp. P2]